MEKDQLVQFLKSTNLVSPETAQLIAAEFSYKSISKNQLHLKEGQIADEYMFLESGFMRSFAYDTDGNDITTNFYNERQIVFEVSSFFNRTISKENIIALEDCTGYCITYVQLNNLFHTLPEFREFGRAILVKGFSSLKNRMLSMITETAEERYTTLLKTNPEIFQNAPLKAIATYLGITDTSLSRIRKEFAKK